MARKSYVYRILARLAYLQARSDAHEAGASTIEMFVWILAVNSREERLEIPESFEEFVGTMRNLEGIGVIQGSSEDSEGCRWRFAGSLPPNSEILDRDGGSGEQPPPPPKPGDCDGDGGDHDDGGRDGDGDGGGGGPGGLAQILAHPVLFALDEEDLDAALAHAFGLNQDEAGG